MAQAPRRDIADSDKPSARQIYGSRPSGESQVAGRPQTAGTKSGFAFVYGVGSGFRCAQSGALDCFEPGNPRCCQNDDPSPKPSAPSRASCHSRSCWRTSARYCCGGKGSTVNQIIKTAKQAKPYAEWIIETIKQNSKPGEKVLAVVHKGLLDHEYLPNGHRDFNHPFDLEGRMVCFIHWGSGIGSNRWKDAGAVFLFGEFHVPKRAMVGTSLGLRAQRATSSALAPFQSPNPKGKELAGIREGHLLRWMKQIAMRGNARNIDGQGKCGEQRLYVTGEFERLIQYKDIMFPGAQLTIQRTPEQTKQQGVKGLVSFLYTTEASEITTLEIQELTGVSLQKNMSRYLSYPIVQQALRDTGRTFDVRRGRGNRGRFVRSAALRPTSVHGPQQFNADPACSEFSIASHGHIVEASSHPCGHSGSPPLALIDQSQRTD
ncbi:Uncharacterised protein [Afipia felis]|uniref:Uncharacterized protein n=2 Tax=Afipia felis TaxID=1035 RepID=A0A380W6E3_AFIFE|nr:hypothetical protein HMPREF9697_03452 [Afipia felis ATCC 53690]SUU75668.1 Uncharacterised protein [Afipia felis]SUU83735.1 Uncharacterised protein [Afipia felis]